MDRPVLSFLGRHVKGRELLAYIADFAAFLVGHGVKRGDVVTLVLPNLPVSVVAFYAVSYLGGIISVLHPTTPREGILASMRKTGSKTVIAFDKLHYDWQTDQAQVLLVGAGAFRDKLFAWGVDVHNRVGKCRSPRYEWRGGYAPVPSVPQSGEDVCLYLPSGGTTGEPKTVVLTSRALNSSLPATVGINPEFVREECMLMALPLYHGFGIAVCMHAVLPCGVRVVPVAKFDPKRIARLLVKQKVTLIAGVPTLYARLLSVGAFDARGLVLRNAYVGGDRLDPAIKRDFDERMRALGLSCRLYEGWGLAEGVAVCTANSPRWGERSGSIGRPVQGVEVVVVCEGRLAAPLEQGELAIGGDTLMQGYLEGGETWIDLDGKRYLATGDVGYYDEEGWFYFVGRTKRMTILAGINVYHQEVEREASAIEGVDECVVVERTQEGKPVLCLLYVGSATPDAVRAALSARLNRYQVPKTIEQVQSLPHNALGKVDYRAC